MRAYQLLSGTALIVLLATSHQAAAQPTGGLPVRPGRTTQYVYRNGQVLERIGNQTTPLVNNIRLPNGTKVNVKSGIVEFPNGKITSLHEGDYLNADGGLVFATPASAAASRGDYSVAPEAKFDQYVQVGSAPTVNTLNAPNEREQLLIRKIDLLNRKISLLEQTHPNIPDMSGVDKQLQDLDTQLKGVK